MDPRLPVDLTNDRRCVLPSSGIDECLELVLEDLVVNRLLRTVEDVFLQQLLHLVFAE